MRVVKWLSQIRRVHTMSMVPGFYIEGEIYNWIGIIWNFNSQNLDKKKEED